MFFGIGFTPRSRLWSTGLRAWAMMIMLSRKALVERALVTSKKWKSRWGTDESMWMAGGFLQPLGREVNLLYTFNLTHCKSIRYQGKRQLSQTLIEYFPLFFRFQWRWMLHNFSVLQTGRVSLKKRDEEKCLISRIGRNYSSCEHRSYFRVF